MNFIKTWLVFLFVLGQSTNAEPVANCWQLLTRSNDPTIPASQSFDRILTAQADQLGIHLPLQSRATRFSRWRARQALKDANTINFYDENQRDQWIERVVSLKIEEDLDLFSTVRTPIPAEQRSALTRLVIRSLLRNGLSVGRETPDFRSSFRTAINRIRNHPFFRAAIYLQLPRRTIVLSDEQVLAVLEYGGAALDSDPEILRLSNSERRETIKRQVNKTAIAVLVTFLTAYGGFQVYPTIDSGYEAGHSTAVHQNTERFVNQVEDLSALSSEALVLTMAKSELQVLNSDFEKKYGEAPTASEEADLRSHVCRLRYGILLSPTAQAECMATR